MPLPQTLIDQFVGVAHSSLSAMKEMLEAHPDLLHARASWDESAMEAASHTAGKDRIQYLLEKGAPLDIFAAIILGMRDRVAAYLEEQPELARAKGAHGIPITFYPAIVGDISLGELLLAKGAEVNAGAGGNTALHGTAHFNQPAYAEWLIRNGADVNVRDYQGLTPLAVAQQNGFQEVADLLRRHGACL
jgi:ankyrin repeat protein